MGKCVPYGSGGVTAQRKLQQSGIRDLKELIFSQCFGRHVEHSTAVSGVTDITFSRQRTEMKSSVIFEFISPGVLSENFFAHNSWILCAPPQVPPNAEQGSVLAALRPI